MFKCPACNGDGEQIEPCMDFEQGPSYSCWFCFGTGKVNVIDRIIWACWKMFRKVEVE